MKRSITEQHIIDKAQGYLRIALPLMSKHKVPITPQNYYTWYQYVSNQNAALKNRIDGILNTGAPFTKEVNDNLYNEYCAEFGEEILKKLRDDLQAMLGSVISEFAEITGKTEEFNSALSESASKLTEDVSLETFKQILGEIVEETKTMNSHTHAVKAKLEKRTSELESLQNEFEKAKMEASVDFLTSVANRKAFNENLETLARKAADEGKSLCLLVLDIDHFKKFNDTHGHIVGDEVLVFVAKTIKANVRGRDFIARFGGEEFVVLLPVTPIVGAAKVAENIRSFFAQAVLKTSATSKALGNITVSIGVAEYRPGEDLDGFVHRADEALYHAKNTGRNKVCTEYDL
jgi:diguanylate cyclase